MIARNLLAAAALWLAAPVSAAEGSIDSAAVFGVREGVEDASLSPDGSKIAYLTPLEGQGSALLIGPLDGSAEPKPVLFADGKPERLGGCRWAADTRLVCSIYGVTVLADGGPAYFSRQVAVDSDGKNLKVLINRGGTGAQLGYNLYGGGVIDWLPEEQGSVLMTREFVPEASTGTLLREGRSGTGVVRVDTRNLSTSTVEAPRDTASEFITDGRGNVRIMGLARETGAGYQSGTTSYRYRTKASKDWKPLSDFDTDGNGFNPYGVDPDLDVAYGLKKHNGRYAAFAVSLDGSLTEKLVFARPEVDVDGFVRIGRRGRIVGATYATDRRQVKYFDPELEKLAGSLAKAIPQLPLIRFVDSNVDESRLLIWAGSDTNPGRYFLFDRKAKQLGELMPARPQLEKVALAAMKAVSYRAADGTAVPGYLTLPPGKESAQGLPGIVMPHGGPGARDEWGFDWWAQYFANRGFAVLQPNFRGSSGYGDAWFQENGFRSWRTAIGDVVDGGRWLVSEGVDPAKLAIVGWSYGGYAALQSAAVEPGLFRAAIAVAPVTDLELLKEESRGWTNFRVVEAFVGNGRHIEEGSPARQAEKIKAPVLLFHGTLDRNVGVGQSRRMLSKLEGTGVKAELITYDKLDHYLDDSGARSDMLLKSDAFLRKALGL